MTPQELKTRLRTGEDGRTEFKSVQGNGPGKDDMAKELVAFANSGGGCVILGVEDDCRVSGIASAKEAESWQTWLVSIARDVVRPALRIHLRTLEVDGQLVVVAEVPGHQPGRPFMGKTKYFVRDGPTSREARPDEVKRAWASAATLYFDEQPIEDAEAEDLDPQAVSSLVDRVAVLSGKRAPQKTLHALKLTDTAGKPTVAGILLCGKEPQHFLVDARVSAVRYPGTNLGRNFTDRKEMLGTVTRQLDDAVAFIARHVTVPEHISGISRETQVIPIDVWREAVTNALCHRDYNVASQVRVFVFDDRVEIVNPGGLLNEQTIDGIKLVGTSQRRNPYLTAVMMRLGHAESMGTGVPEMIRLITEAGFPEPEFQVAHGEFRLIIPTHPVTEATS